MEEPAHNLVACDAAQLARRYNSSKGKEESMCFPERPDCVVLLSRRSQKDTDKLVTKLQDIASEKALTARRAQDDTTLSAAIESSWSIRQFVAFQLQMHLAKSSWIRVEQDPTSLTFLETSFMSESNSLLPAVNSACVSVQIEDVSVNPDDGRCSAAMSVTPSVRKIYPAAQLTKSAVQTSATVYVLPRVTGGTLEEIHDEGVVPKPTIELQDKGGYERYWHLVHGYHLPSSAMTRFMTVSFGSLILSYPIGCVWRELWAPLPAASKSHSKSIASSFLRATSNIRFYASSEEAHIVTNIDIQPPAPPVPSAPGPSPAKAAAAFITGPALRDMQVAEDYGDRDTHDHFQPLGADNIDLTAAMNPSLNKASKPPPIAKPPPTIRVAAPPAKRPAQSSAAKTAAAARPTAPVPPPSAGAKKAGRVAQGKRKARGPAAKPKQAKKPRKK
ncbi:unnamed protein product [Vitrella brassicaformis CCMP3155]|uniref:Uncharacterized protein n=1 Tax=Vitrella brassicaformis (strain CCMP3155) TaxID=1169540 RepID=A0A0G4EN19_VITBC|nr:unnamed protein product [Vitrella brassicaformis CCMP3155]|eukprot:CEL99227.1 unnamed protein product [Vitrella brassicaformis CCMP3155]